MNGPEVRNPLISTVDNMMKLYSRVAHLCASDLLRNLLSSLHPLLTEIKANALE